MNFDTLFVNPNGRTARAPFTGALAVLLAAFAFYYFLVPGLTSLWCQFMLVYPALVLHARRLQDMGKSPWLLAVPAALLTAAFCLKLQSPGSQPEDVLSWAALVVSAGYALWGLAGK